MIKRIQFCGLLKDNVKFRFLSEQTATTQYSKKALCPSPHGVTEQTVVLIDTFKFPTITNNSWNSLTQYFSTW